MTALIVLRLRDVIRQQQSINLECDGRTDIEQTNLNGMFTRPETDTEANKKWLTQDFDCVGVFILHRDMTTQMHIGFCALLTGICLGLGLVHEQYECTRIWQK